MLYNALPKVRPVVRACAVFGGEMLGNAVSEKYKESGSCRLARNASLLVT